jgi:hypothetical protein
VHVCLLVRLLFSSLVVLFSVLFTAGRAEGSSSPLAEAAADNAGGAAEPVPSEAAAAVAAAAAAAAADEEEEEEDEPSYAELHPLVVPKTLKDLEGGKGSMRGAVVDAGGGGGGGAGASRKARSRKAAADAAAAPAPAPARKATTRVELRLSQLEADLKQADHLLLQGE